MNYFPIFASMKISDKYMTVSAAASPQAAGARVCETMPTNDFILASTLVTPKKTVGKLSGTPATLNERSFALAGTSATLNERSFALAGTSATLNEHSFALAGTSATLNEHSFALTRTSATTEKQIKQLILIQNPI